MVSRRAMWPMGLLFANRHIYVDIGNYGRCFLAHLIRGLRRMFPDRNLSVVCHYMSPISTKLKTKHSWVKGIQLRSIEGPRPFQREDYYKTGKVHLRNIGIFF